MAGFHRSLDHNLDRKRRINISIPGYDAAKEVKRVDDRFKRLRESEKQKAKGAVQAAQTIEAAKNAKVAEQLEELNAELAKPVKPAVDPAAESTKGDEACIFL